MKLRWFIPIALLIPLRLSATDAAVGARVATITINPREITVLHLRPEFESTIRMPEEVTSVILGSPGEFKAEHNEGEPEYVYVKPITKAGRSVEPPDRDEIGPARDAGVGQRWRWHSESIAAGGLPDRVPIRTELSDLVRLRSPGDASRSLARFQRMNPVAGTPARSYRRFPISTRSSGSSRK